MSLGKRLQYPFKKEEEEELGALWYLSTLIDIYYHGEK